MLCDRDPLICVTGIAKLAYWQHRPSQQRRLVQVWPSVLGCHVEKAGLANRTETTVAILRGQSAGRIQKPSCRPQTVRRSQREGRIHRHRQPRGHLEALSSIECVPSPRRRGRTRIHARKIQCGHPFVKSRSHNGRCLRHRPKRSERRLNYGKFYQGQPASPNIEGVPKA